ncbi:DHH family phosphoesterase, partial [Candidatus Woesearchaeota archaeon]|nr:DHH family phosphoesterase [Candidatus Woesearchaeota archaeon]
MYVCRHPLIVDGRVLEAADKLGIEVQASPEKWLVNTTLENMLLILRQFGSEPMSLLEYWQVRKDALDANDQDMLSSLESDQFSENLATVFLNDRWMVHHPEVLGARQFDGNKIPVNTPKGRYGWVHPDDFSFETGLPTKVKHVREIGDGTVKYWDTHTIYCEQEGTVAVRSFVTSVGKSSCDLGFPFGVISPKISIRECRATLPTGVLDTAVIDQAKALLDKYYAAMDSGILYTRIQPWQEELIDFVQNHAATLRQADDLAARVIKDDLTDAFGIMSTYAIASKEHVMASQLKYSAQLLSGITDHGIDDNHFLEFMSTRKSALEDAIESHKSLVFVLGHDNPDTDTVVSAIAEAYRQHLIRGDESVFIPVVPGNSTPKEVVELIGSQLAQQLILSESLLYQQGSKSGRPEWIMVDHNIGPEQPNTRAIIDHHQPSDVCKKQQIPKRILFAGSTAALVAQRIYGLGIEIPQLLSRYLNGAALMDTENRLEGKMTPLDHLIMDRFSGYYRGLMRQLISCYDSEELFTRDYKEDWNYFGFAVAKSIGILDETHQSILERLQQLAQENNLAKNLPLTLVKVVDYAQDAETIRRERVYTVFNDTVSPEFINTVFDTIEVVVRSESGVNVQIERGNRSIDYWGVGTQLSRKKLAPVMDLVTKAFNEFFYSPSTGLYFKRDFLRTSSELEAIADSCGVELHTSREGIVVGNPMVLKFLSEHLGQRFATPSEYFRAYFDALAVNDHRMAAHLAHSGYLEAFDAAVEDFSYLVEHPDVALTHQGFQYIGGNRKKVHIPRGDPGLIDPNKIDLETGFPQEVEDPNQYGTGLWRYWSPDRELVWVIG